MNTLPSIQAEIDYRNQQARRTADIVRLVRSGRTARPTRRAARRRDRRDEPGATA